MPLWKPVSEMSYRQMACAVPLLRSLFSDSEVATKISCSRTKTEAIINGILSPHSKRMIKQDVANIPFLGVGIDASNHKNVKMFPITTQYLDKDKGLKVRLLHIDQLGNEKSETVASYLQEMLQENGLTEKFSAFVADNANTNFGGINRGGRNNIFYTLKQSLNKPHLIGIGSSSHIIHNAVHHGLDRFGLFDIDCLVYKIFEYFSIYTIRTQELKSFCEFVETGYNELLSHSKTRWLSLFPAVERIIKMFEALKSYFQSKMKSPVMIENFFEHFVGECFLLFVHSLMSLFHPKMATLERKNNSILEMDAIFEDLYEKLYERRQSKFVPLSVKSILAKLRKYGKDNICDDFLARVDIVYYETLEYFKAWTESFAEFKIFPWLDLRKGLDLQYLGVFEYLPNFILYGAI